MKRCILLFAVGTVILSGCAYYNTFFNAKKQFNQAEKTYQDNPPDQGPSNAQRDLYEQAIKKASKVIVFHPNSKYVDDALFLMGKAYFRMEEYSKARRKFEELLANYPKSEFRREANYLLGTVHCYVDEREKARDALMAVIEDKKKNPWADDARYMLGDMAFWSGDYQTAAKEFARIPEDYPKSERKAQALYMTGQSHFELGNYRPALAAYQEASQYQFRGKRRYEINLRIGQCYQRLSEHQKALQVFDELARSDLYVEYLPEIRLRVAEASYQVGDTTRALEEYDDIIKKNPKTEEAAWAYYQLGIIQMQSLNDLSLASDLFNNSKAEAPASEAAKLSSLKRLQIQKLEEYKARVAAADSLPDPEANFALAEVYLLDLNRPDTALVYYQKVLEQTPLSKYASRSAYVAARLVESSLGDTVRSLAMLRDLISNYPTTESANAARKQLGLPAFVDTTYRTAANRLLQAEQLLLKDDDVDGALIQYRSIVTDFPESPYAAKAECAIAWTMENVKGDIDSARVLFKQLAQRYPDSECAALAKKKAAPPPVAVTVDTSAAVLTDTTGGGMISVEQTEEVKEDADAKAVGEAGEEEEELKEEELKEEELKEEEPKEEEPEPEPEQQDLPESQSEEGIGEQQ